MNRRKSPLYLLFLAYLGLLAFLCYGTNRSEFLWFFVGYTLLFGLYVVISRRLVLDRVSIRQVFLLAILCRVMVAFGMPHLSDDVYRFLWDGHLVVNGENPYKQLPSDFIQNEGEDGKLKSLFPKLNSPDYFSVYPPSNQLIFSIATWITEELWEQVLILRLILLAFECWAIYLMLGILRQTKKPLQWIWWYVLNPLIVLEIVGNIHFEGVMLPFLLLGIRWFLQKRELMSGAALGLAVGVKLTPLILLPVLLFHYKDHRLIFMIIGFVLAIMLAFIPLFWGNSFLGFYQSIQLYYGDFEFNASIYYLIRQIGYWWHGYNMIGSLSKFLAISACLIIIAYSWFSDKRSVFSVMKKCATIYLLYLLLSLVVHPWYLVPLIALGILSGQFYPLVWSFAVILSYSAYQNPDYQESLLLIGLEYALLFVAIYFEKYLHLLPKTFNFK